MALPQGLFHWPGIPTSKLLSGSIGMGHGTTPAVATLYIAPVPVSQIELVGTLRWTYGNFSRNWKDARIDLSSSDIGNDGKKVWVVTIHDRRWKWKAGPGAISGYYNHKIAGGEEIIKGREKTPRELAELCLRAMGENTWTGMNNVPTQPRPIVEWDQDNPCEALNNLLEMFGCRICLDKQERVKIVQVGRGNDLPGGGTVLTTGEVLNPPERPDEIKTLADHTMVQCDLRLIAVGLDTDGEIRPINDLSYKPAGGWIKLDPHKYNNVSDPLHKDFAKASVFRWYQIAVPFSFRLSDGGQLYSIQTLSEVLPLFDKQVHKTPSKGPNVNRQPLPPWVYGIFYQGKERDRNNITQMNPNIVGTNKLTGGLYGGGFEVDKERGIVKFSEPVYSYIPATQAQPSQVRQADLRLRIAFPWRESKTMEYHRYARARQANRRYGTEARVEKREEIALQIAMRYDNNFNITGVDSNQTAVRQYLDYHLDAIEREYQTLRPESKSYGGFIDLELDGRIRQIVYTIAESGAATTQGAADNEELRKVAPYRFGREIEALQHLVDGPKRPPSKVMQSAGAAPPRPEQSAAHTAQFIGGGSATFTGGGGGP